MRLRATHHAIMRYIERVKPALEPKAARVELETLLAALESSPPVWWTSARPSDSTAFAEICDGIAVAVEGKGVVTTVVVRGGVGDEILAARRAHRRLERQKKRTRRQAMARGGSRPKEI
jgi:hypothetical protein